MNSGPEIRIRSFEKQDTAGLMEIFSANVPLFFAKQEVAKFQDYLLRFPDSYYTVLADDCPVGGFGTEFRSDDDSARINWIFFSPGFQGRGLGRQAVRFCFQKFLRQTTSNLVIRTSQHAWKFFSSLGYRLIETQKDYWGKGLDLYLMHMTLTDLQEQYSWGELARLYSEKFLTLSLYDKWHLAFLEQLPPNARVLETGCGPGNVTKFLKRNRPDIDLLASDYSELMLLEARQHNPGLKFMQLDIRNLQTIDEVFDGIFCGFCFPYLSLRESERAISVIAEKLKPGGVLFLSFIEGKTGEQVIQKSSSTSHRIRVNYYSTDWLRSIAEQKGFKPVNAFSLQYPARPEQHSSLLFRS